MITRLSEARIFSVRRFSVEGEDEEGAEERLPPRNQPAIR